jgi:hypothetical protein
LPLGEELSTQTAANSLGPLAAGVLEYEAHTLSFHYTGTHPRVLLKNLLDYQTRSGRAVNPLSTSRANRGNSGEYNKFDIAPP